MQEANTPQKDTAYPGKERLFALVEEILVIAEEKHMDIVLRFRREPETARRFVVYVAELLQAANEPPEIY